MSDTIQRLSPQHVDLGDNDHDAIMRNDPDGLCIWYADHLAEVAKMKGEIDTLRHNSCPVCCGKPISGKPCVCEGSGDAVMAYGGIANILAQTELGLRDTL